MVHYFDDEYHFLSNFYESEVVIEGEKYPTAEHAYQILKNNSKENIVHIKTLTPLQAKRYMSKQLVRKDWDELKVYAMYLVVKDKFTRHDELKKKLLETRGKKIVEGNYWGDTFWGVSAGIGQNNLGKVLMKVREELQGY